MVVSEDRIKEVLNKVPKKMLIGGEWVDGASKKTLRTLNPYDETLLAEVAEADEADVDKAVKAAREAFDKGPWPRMTGKERARIMGNFTKLWEDNQEELALIEALDSGKPIKQAQEVDVPWSIDHMWYFTGWADKALCGKTIQCGIDKYFGYTLHEPIGVAAQIIPWNFPQLMLSWKWGPALAAGNCIVMKVASETPLSALYLGRLAQEAGFPPGVINLIVGKGSVVGMALAKHPWINKLAFTGSTEVGKIIGTETAKNVVPTTLELGGKSPAIVWKDVDLDKAVEDTTQAIFFNTGQACTAASRTFVHEDIYDKFVEKAAAKAQSYKIGNTLDPGTHIGAQINEKQLKKTLSFIEKGKQQGARLVTGGKRVGDKGYIVEPTIFADVKDDMDIAKYEIFGPVMSIFKYSTLDEALERANRGEYGLAAGVWAQDVDVVNKVTRTLQAGSVWVNMYNVLDSRMPFGGYKQSGIGRERSDYVLHHYTEVKACYVKLQESPWL